MPVHLPTPSVSLYSCSLLSSCLKLATLDSNESPQIARDDLAARVPCDGNAACIAANTKSVTHGPRVRANVANDARNISPRVGERARVVAGMTVELRCDRAFQPRMTGTLIVGV